MKKRAWTEEAKRPKADRAPTKRGRTTPKGTTKGAGDIASGRYTPPTPRSQKISPPWVPALMFSFLILGMLMIVLNYMNLLPGDEPSNIYLITGLVLITGGFITATQYH